MASSHTYIVVTGANAGLGFGICQLLITDFLTTRPSSAELTLLFTTRDKTKGLATQTALSTHIATHSPTASSRIHLRPENVELTNLHSVSALAKKLLHDPTIPHLNALILNAGIAGTTGIDFPRAIWQILTENAAAVTWPRFKRSAVGSVTARQLPEGNGKGADTDEGEPPLGHVFTANVFGHYMLTQRLMSALRKCPQGNPGRIIWISSIEAGAYHFREDDLMGLRSGTAYECSKRVTDLLALTAGCEAAGGSVRGFMGEGEGEGTRPEMLLCQPGIVATGIVPLPTVLMGLWVGTAYVMRWIGSPWHTNSAANGAVSAVWLALAGEEEIREKAGGGAGSGARVKWGSVVDRTGTARVEMTDVQGWGVNGSGQPVRETWWGGGWGRMIGAKDATAENVEEFVGQGARVWREMEALRRDWDVRLQRYEHQDSRRS